MDQELRLSSQEHQHRALRFRALAATVTTPRAKAYLLAQAGHSDGLAAGRVNLAPARLDNNYERTARRGAWR